MKRNFEHKECRTTLTDVTPRDAFETRCWKCEKRFLGAEEYVKMTKENPDE